MIKLEFDCDLLYYDISTEKYTFIKGNYKSNFGKIFTRYTKIIKLVKSTYNTVNIISVYISNIVSNEKLCYYIIKINIVNNKKLFKVMEFYIVL